MEWIIDLAKEKINTFIGWAEILLRKEKNYKYFIDKIDLDRRAEPPRTFIHYKITGCRNLSKDTAIELNKKAVFDLFRPDHAQIIVTLATLDAVLGKSGAEIFKKYQDYVSLCSMKINENSKT